MRVLLLPSDRGGCGIYRMMQPGRAIARAHPDIELEVAEGVLGYRGPDGRVTGVSPGVNQYDVVVFQRPCHRDVYDTILLVQQAGVPVVCELDDDVEKVQQQNQAWRYLNPAFNPLENWEWCRKSMAAADHITVSTPALRRYSPGGRATVVRNAVPRSMVEFSRTDKEGPIVVSWPGTRGTHPDDLEVTGGAVGRIMKEFEDKAVFRVVGDGIGVQKALGLPVEPEVRGWVPLGDYPDELAQIDIGIVPLADNAFNRGKSWLKMMEFASLGVPTVASPSPENLELASQGVGVIARKPHEWARELRKLLEDDAWRKELGERGRQVVRERHLTEMRTEEWLGAWKQAVGYRRGAPQS